ncbi:MAG TPA: cobalamin biosynthesis protein [Methanobacteriaceae archaeon]|nr:cobalamin biosynthesis protein [Methanobacteriaceae archaeon]
MLELIIIITLAIVMDLIWGEFPTKIHPVVWMGKVIEGISTPLLWSNSRISGLILTIITSACFILLFYLILQLATSNFIFYVLIAALVTSSTFAIRELFKTASEICDIMGIDLKRTRILVSYLVSRDTTKSSSEDLVSSTVESVTENINDSVTAPIFYIILIGSLTWALFRMFSINSSHMPILIDFNVFNYLIQFKNPLTTLVSVATFAIIAGVFYRVINTLDAMVGYKNEKYSVIGWFPARLDDILNYIPSRVTGLLIVIAALIGGFDWKNSWKIMRRDARKTPSPNSGFPMAAAAGALNVRLEKPGVYILGDPGKSLDQKIIKKTLYLTKITIVLFLMAGFIILILLGSR